MPVNQKEELKNTEQDPLSSKRPRGRTDRPGGTGKDLSLSARSPREPGFIIPPFTYISATWIELVMLATMKQFRPVQPGSCQAVHAGSVICR